MENLTFDELPKAVSQLYEKLHNIEKLILERSIENEPEQEQLFTIQQAAEFLNLSVPTLYGYVHRAEIPVCKRGKRLYFSSLELLNWIKMGRKKTLSETAQEAEQYINKTERR